MTDFEHERLDVYQRSVQFLAQAEVIASTLGKGRAYIADQLHRAALSITLNIAEGAGEFAAADKARFYRMARRSATECAAILDSCRVLKLVEEDLFTAGRGSLMAVVAMLTVLVKRVPAGSAGS
jgi:four helix bundle protein